LVCPAFAATIHAVCPALAAAIYAVGAVRSSIIDPVCAALKTLEVLTRAAFTIRAIFTAI
jgi:hypothetical protein